MKDGGPAFSITAVIDPSSQDILEPGWMGMSLRDWFAGQVIPAVIQSVHAAQSPFEGRDVAEFAYKVADAMLAEREKEDPL